MIKFAQKGGTEKTLLKIVKIFSDKTDFVI